MDDRPPGMPDHIPHGSIPALTRCGLFAAGLPSRVTPDPGSAHACHACITEGPAAAYVTLPDGTVIERRTPALDSYPYAVAITRGDRWELRAWADSEDEARCLASTPGPARVVLPVRHAGTSGPRP